MEEWKSSHQVMGLLQEFLDTAECVSACQLLPHKTTCSGVPHWKQNKRGRGKPTPQEMGASMIGRENILTRSKVYISTQVSTRVSFEPCLLCLSIWMCGSKSTPCWAALPGLILVLNFLATSNPVVFSNVTNPALQQVFSSACKVALGYKALYRCLLLMLQSKQIKKKKANDYTYKKKYSKEEHTTMMAALALPIF